MIETRDEVLTAEQAAQLLNVSPAHIRAMAKKKQLPGLQLGTRWCFSRDRIMAKVRGEDDKTKTAV